jgi:hypothetical protein
MNDIHTVGATARRQHPAGSIERPGQPIDRTTEAILVGAIADREELR